MKRGLVAKVLQDSTLLVLSMLVAIAALAWLPGGARAAEEGAIEWYAEAGIGGLNKDGKWMPLKITLTNRTGSAIEGELVFTRGQGNNSGDASYIVPVELPPGTPIEVKLTVPGGALAKGNNMLAFYEDSAKSGPKLGMMPDTGYIEVRAKSAYAVGIVARDKNTLNFLAILNASGFDIQTIILDEAAIPEDPRQLDALDTLVLNDVATSAWTERQREAIEVWVERGGSVVFAGGAGYAMTAEPFGSLAPVATAGTGVLDDFRELDKAGGASLNYSGDITVSTGELQGAVPMLTTAGGEVLAASKRVGRGHSVYVAFDPALEPFNSWAGSPELWSYILSDNLTPSLPGAVNFGQYDNNYWGMSNVLNLFPTLKAPSFYILLLCFAAYLILVAPVLYFLLKKLDRREWSWWIIPSLAVASSVAIFFVGAADKRETLVHSLHIVDLDGNGQGLRSSAVAVFVPTGGKVETSFSHSATVSPYASSGTDGNVFSEVHAQAIRMNGEQTLLSWSNVPFWSVRKTWVYQNVKEAAGQFELAVAIENGDAVLTVTNQTGHDQTDVHILLHNYGYKIGDLRKGEAKSATIPLHPSQLQPGTPMNYGYDYASLIYPYIGREEAETERRRALINSRLNQNKTGMNAYDPLIIGFGQDSQPWFEVNGKRPSTSNLTLWAQPFPLDYVSGENIVHIPGSIQPIITGATMQYSSVSASGMVEYSPGELEFEYQLPRYGEVHYDRLTIWQQVQLPQGGAQLLIWDNSSQEWTDITTVAELSDVERYLSEQAIIRMKLVASSHDSYMLPIIGLQGGIKR